MRLFYEHQPAYALARSRSSINMCVPFHPVWALNQVLLKCWVIIPHQSITQPLNIWLGIKQFYFSFLSKQVLSPIFFSPPLVLQWSFDFTVWSLETPSSVFPQQAFPLDTLGYKFNPRHWCLPLSGGRNFLWVDGGISPSPVLGSDPGVSQVPPASILCSVQMLLSLLYLLKTLFLLK